ncbi:glycine--tRNA ligase [Candidatus Woesearchaeota archaeon]|nr:glycine--tRNA ligase [Candidatus Woesearchaeota archaeon]
MHTSLELAAFCKKKGFMYPSSEIYGGLSGFYDYGHLGTKLKHNFEHLWRSFFLGLNDNFHEIETANIAHENVFKASGHLQNFTDPVASCKKCGFHVRADHFLAEHLKRRVEGKTTDEYQELITQNKLGCPQCKSVLTVSVLNMMFPVKLGVGKVQTGYLRPETAQSPYVNFKLQYELLRKKLPLGLALIGRAYRNEISPRNFTLRQREFVQAELQIFFDPQHPPSESDFALVKDQKLKTTLILDREQNKVVERTAQQLVDSGLPEFYVYHLIKIQEFYFQHLKISPEKFRFYQLSDQEKAFYNKYHFDLEIDLAEHGWTEVGGLHYRTDHDLSGHQKISQQSMEVLEEATGRKFIPHVLELSFGVDRHIYALLDLSYEMSKEREYVVLHLPAKVTPYFCAVFPLVKNKPEIVALGEQVYQDLKQHFSCLYDETAAVGRRYARADEQGIKYCITVDFDSLQDHAVTIRDRDSTQQERVKISQLKEKLALLFS